MQNNPERICQKHTENKAARGTDVIIITAYKTGAAGKQYGDTRQRDASHALSGECDQFGREKGIPPSDLARHGRHMDWSSCTKSQLWSRLCAERTHIRRTRKYCGWFLVCVCMWTLLRVVSSDAVMCLITFYIYVCVCVCVFFRLQHTTCYILHVWVWVNSSAYTLHTSVGKWSPDQTRRMIDLVLCADKHVHRSEWVHFSLSDLRNDETYIAIYWTTTPSRSECTWV